MIFDGTPEMRADGNLEEEAVSIVAKPSRPALPTWTKTWEGRLYPKMHGVICDACKRQTSTSQNGPIDAGWQSHLAKFHGREIHEQREWDYLHDPTMAGNKDGSRAALDDLRYNQAEWSRSSASLEAAVARWSTPSEAIDYMTNYRLSYEDELLVAGIEP